MEKEDKIILEGVFTTIPNTHHSGRIYPRELFQKYFKEEQQKIKQELRLKKLKRLIDDVE